MEHGERVFQKLCGTKYQLNQLCSDNVAVKKYEYHGLHFQNKLLNSVISYEIWYTAILNTFPLEVDPTFLYGDEEIFQTYLNDTWVAGELYRSYHCYQR